LCFFLNEILLAVLKSNFKWAEHVERIEREEEFEDVRTGANGILKWIFNTYVCDIFDVRRSNLLYGCVIGRV